MRKITASMGIALVLLYLCLAFPTEIPTPSLVKATSFSLEKIPRTTPVLSCLLRKRLSHRTLESSAFT